MTVKGSDLRWKAQLGGCCNQQEVKWKWTLPSCVQLFVTPWTIQSMEFSRPEYWSGWPFPSPGELPNPGIEPRSPALQPDSLPAEPQGKPPKCAFNKFPGEADIAGPGTTLWEPFLWVIFNRGSGRSENINTFIIFRHSHSPNSHGPWKNICVIFFSKLPISVSHQAESISYCISFIRPSTQHTPKSGLRMDEYLESLQVHPEHLYSGGRENPSVWG